MRVEQGDPRLVPVLVIQLLMPTDTLSDLLGLRGSDHPDVAIPRTLLRNRSPGTINHYGHAVLARHVPILSDTAGGFIGHISRYCWPYLDGR